MRKIPSVKMMQELAIFRPVCGDGAKDYFIPSKIARSLFERGEISRDMTNGGYCPNPKSNYNVRQHKVDRFA